MFLIEDDYGISKNFQQIIDAEILSNSFPWYWQDSSTSYKYPFLSHIIIPRYDIDSDQPKINSPCFSLFDDIRKSFCDIHGIEFKRYLRISLNLSYHFTTNNSEPHIDHPIPHKTIIMYLNDFTSGATVVFDKQYDGTTSTFSNDVDIPILKKLEGKKGKISCFDGSYYHATEWPDEGQRRVICVMTFE
jgi:hypothetical protein